MSGGFPVRNEKSMNPEHLAAWYFRLNGFFSINNFVLHPSRRGAQRTDADIVGVRFPYRTEFPDEPGGDQDEFRRIVDTPYFVIAEVKRSRCELNGPWTDKGKQNVEQILRDLGPFPSKEVPVVAESLYTKGVFSGLGFYCSLFCVGNQVNPDLNASYPCVPQVTWEQILLFVAKRFDTYCRRKADHSSWDEAGQSLWNCWEGNGDDEFINKARKHFGLTSTA
jgi:hypothetical protein